MLGAECRVVESLGTDQEDVDRVFGKSLPNLGPVGVLAEFIVTARMPARVAAIWSRMSESSGETMIVGPAPLARSSAVATK